eukprot:TRINITY_DN2298_c0_g1_i2.p1 TRINITY_DN2298_c0_g1~~TRINITY_DN2298_c0_g1_i2.p1  ORF type:complete len:233 (-),score=37.15 TRINITY_DN2298_c0_g1_i2:17-715(-)
MQQTKDIRSRNKKGSKTLRKNSFRFNNSWSDAVGTLIEFRHLQSADPDRLYHHPSMSPSVSYSANKKKRWMMVDEIDKEYGVNFDPSSHPNNNIRSFRREYCKMGGALVQSYSDQENILQYKAYYRRSHEEEYNEPVVRVSRSRKGRHVEVVGKESKKKRRARKNAQKGEDNINNFEGVNTFFIINDTVAPKFLPEGKVNVYVCPCCVNRPKDRNRKNRIGNLLRLQDLPSI